MLGAQKMIKQPISLYKYQSGNDDSILNLVTCTSIMSSRVNLNDPYDSRAIINDPNPIDVYNYLITKGAEATLVANDIVKNGQYTENGRKYLDGQRAGLNKLLDSVALYCLSSNPKNVLMWSHYANSHKGFCIEYKPNCIPAIKMKYKAEIFKIDLINQVKAIFESSVNEYNGQVIEDVICTKLIDWEYESEYRLINAENGKLFQFEDGKSIHKFEYDPSQVASIIFGCKMDIDKIYAIGKALKYRPKFKMAVQTINGIDIKDL